MTSPTELLLAEGYKITSDVKTSDGSLRVQKIEKGNKCYAVVHVAGKLPEAMTWLEYLRRFFSLIAEAGRATQ